MNMFGKGAAPAGAAAKSIILSSNYPSWDALTGLSKATHTGQRMDAEEVLRIAGEGDSHQDAKIRLFGSKGTPRVTYYRDTAAWCPYCQKVWILLEEKKIPYIVEKIAMRSYGDKPASYLKLVPSGLLPAMNIDGEFMTDSLKIMMALDSTFEGPNHRPMWPKQGSKDAARAQNLMRLERDLFSRWCNLVFRGSMGNGAIKSFEDGLDKVNEELSVTASPWFLDEMTIVDLTYITHIERMCASVAYWSGRQIRGDRWPAIERWMTAFEAMPSYMATKSDYYTHVTDIPPQYGPGYSLPGSQGFAGKIDGTDDSWNLPLPPLSSSDVEPYGAPLDQGEEAARHEAAHKIIKNHAAIGKFALRGAGKDRGKQFQAPLADPYAVSALEHTEDMDALMKKLTHSLLVGYKEVGTLEKEDDSDNKTKRNLIMSLAYFRDRIGVPRDMSYPAARQLRAHLNHISSQI
eukprot:CAMPEP_0119034544 /NCGR_PEP_ID=MMETSP1177-20130426/1526_1 /TAXON_ID=2985 /ORGANISM="Ochromonas sp, Strain CCMP1899" /LENGTH=460 /DNA_ID=CAMNT_0006992041 /DNA_START=112 /DNA_END=1494 /DNA_ORIENTATION=+